MPPYQPRISTRETESTSQPHATDAESPSELWIFPPDNNPDAPPPDAHPDFEHPAQPIDTLANYSYSPLSPPQILIFFRGMEMVYKYQRNPPPMPPAVAQRIELSITAHLRRAGVLLGPQLGFQFIEEGTPIDLRFIDFPLDINLNTTRTNFGLMLQYLAPPTSLQVGVGHRMHTVSQWDIVCRRCGETITHYCRDKYWNSRYIQHRAERRCRIWEAPAVQGAS